MVWKTCGLALSALLFLPFRANSKSGQVIHIPTSLSEFEGIPLNATLSELVEKYDAREITGVPSGTSEYDAISARLHLEAAEKSGYREYRISRPGHNPVDVSVNMQSKQDFILTLELLPEDFLPTVIHYSKILGSPRTYSIPISKSITAQWKKGDSVLEVEIGAKIGEAPKGLNIQGRWAVLGKTQVTLTRMPAPSERAVSQK